MSNLEVSYRLFQERKAKALARRNKKQEKYTRSGSNIMVTFRAAIGKLKADNPGKKWCDLRELQILMGALAWFVILM